MLGLPRDELFCPVSAGSISSWEELLGLLLGGGFGKGSAAQLGRQSRRWDQDDAWIFFLGEIGAKSGGGK